MYDIGMSSLWNQSHIIKLNGLLAKIQNLVSYFGNLGEKRLRIIFILN